jgi:pilus assembly protein CpaB
MFIAIALSAGAFFITMNLTSKKEPHALSEQSQPSIVVPPTQTTQEIATVDIYTAKQDIPIGTVITEDLLDLHPWPKNLLLPDMVIVEQGHQSNIIKMVVRTPFLKGEPIIMNKLANANDPSFLAASLGDGMRLVTVGVDAITGGGGFVFPGDRVDVLITHDVVSTVTTDQVTGKKDVVKAPVTEILVPNVRVMAINQKSTAHGGDAPVVPNTISLEVAANDAQKIHLAENGNGRLSLVLRSLKDEHRNVVGKAVKLMDLSNATDAQGTQSENSQVIVVRGVKADIVEVSKP